MDCEKKSGQISHFPKQSAYKAVFFDRVDSYSCFSIQEIYQDLFVSNKSGVALITFPKEIHKEKSNEALFYFLLPDVIINKVIDNGEVHETDFQEFLIKKNKGRKITTRLIKLFFSEEIDSEKLFVAQVQKHFIEMLKPAVFSDDLSSYLKDFANNVIIPANISPKANEVFNSLLDVGDHSSLSIIIANIFVSAMIGLYPMQYETYETDSGLRFLKTYLLNHLGMEYVWMPEQIGEEYIRLQEIQYYYDKELYTQAYLKALQRLIKENKEEKENKNINKTVHSEIYRLLGLCLLYHPEQCAPPTLDNDFLTEVYQSFNLKHYWPENIVNTAASILKIRENDGVTCLLKAISLDKENVGACFALFEYHIKNNKKKAYKYLETVYKYKYAKAIIEAAFFYLNKECISENISEKDLLEKINYIIANAQKNDVNDVATCLYLRGRFKKNNNKLGDAQKDFERAAAKGNERARQELDLVKRNETRAFPTFSQDPASKYCFANGLTGLNYQTLSTFPGEEWALFAPVKKTKQTKLHGIQSVPDVDKFIKLHKIGAKECRSPKIVFLFMSEEKEKNLNECLELLDKLFNIALGLNEQDKWKLIDKTHIFVNADYDTASMLIDANLSQMGRDIYFKVHIADENRDMVHKLLCEAPLFLPALNGAKSENATHVVLFGGSEMNYTFIKESIASAYLGPKHPIEITLLGENADVLEHRFKQECPGVFGCPQLTCIRPKFIKCKIRETDFPKLIYGQPQSISSSNRASIRKDVNDDIAEALRSGNYFIVDYANDLEDIRFAMELRTWLLRSKDSFDRTPFIAVKVSDKQNAYLTSHLTLAGQAAGSSYYNKYDLFPFGVAADIYHYKNIIQDPVLNKIALQIHKFYYLDNSLDRKDDDKLVNALEKCRRAAENDFYSYSYNADSSLITAIGLCYRFFAASCILDSKEAYLDFGALKSNDLLKKFEDQLNNKESKEKLAKIEQTRWNSALLVRGWLPADKTQVKNYEAQASGSSHKHILAKLHPFINEWDNLDDASLADMFAIFNQRIEYSKKPQVTTRRGIEDTTRFFIKELREKEFSRGE